MTRLNLARRALAHPEYAGLWILGGAVLLTTLPALTVLVYASQFTRYLADDFCYIAHLNTRGLVGSQVYWYTEWSGRLASNFLETFLVWVGAWATPFIPALLLTFWFFAAAWLFFEIILLLFSKRSRLAALALAALSLFTLAKTLPNLTQALYWQLSLLIHLAPLVIGTLTLALLVYQARTARFALPIVGACVGALAFLAGAMSEMFALLQVTFFAAFTFWIFVFNSTSKNLRALALVGLLASGSAFALQLFAPGNHVRAQEMAAPRALLPLVRQTSEYSWLALSQVINTRWRELSLAFGAAFLFGALLSQAAASRTLGYNKPLRKISRVLTSENFLLAALPLVILCLVTLSILPVMYALDTFPPPRALTLPHLLLVGGLVLWGMLLGRALFARAAANQRAANFLLAVTILFSLVFVYMGVGSTRIFLETIPPAQAYAHAWDARDASLRRARQQNARRVTAVHLTNAARAEDLGTDPQFWVNVCMARAYGIRALTRE